MLIRRLKIYGYALLLIGLFFDVSAVSLIDALIANGASEFAALLEADSNLLAYALSNQVHTVWAPIDQYNSNNTGAVPLSRRAAVTNTQAVYQMQNTTNSMGDATQKTKRSVELIGDKNLEMNLPDVKLAPANQFVIAEYAFNNHSSVARLRRGLGKFHSAVSWGAPSAHPKDCSTSSEPPPPPDDTTICTESSTAISAMMSTKVLWSTTTTTQENQILSTWILESTVTKTTAEVYSTTTTAQLPPPSAITVTETETETTTEELTAAATLTITETTTAKLTTSLPYTVTETTSAELTTTASLTVTETTTAAVTVTETTTAQLNASVSFTVTVEIPTTTTATEFSVVMSSISSAPSSSSPTPTGNVPRIPIKLASGFGNRVNLLRADIPYDNGLIQITDGYFTIPVTVSETLASTNLTSFLSLMNQANLTSLVDNMHNITIFAPTNTALAAINASSGTDAEIQTLVYSHIVPKFLGYLPSLYSDLTLPTLANTTLTIKVNNGVYYINDALLLDPDVLTDNGVINIIDKVLSNSTAPLQSPSSKAAVQKPALSMIFGLVALSCFWY